MQDGMWHIKDQIDRIRDALVYVIISPSRKQAFEEFYAQVGQDPKNFITK